jgi:hypothetical protein
MGEHNLALGIDNDVHFQRVNAQFKRVDESGNGVFRSQAASAAMPLQVEWFLHQWHAGLLVIFRLMQVRASCQRYSAQASNQQQADLELRMIEEFAGSVQVHQLHSS